MEAKVFEAKGKAVGSCEAQTASIGPCLPPCRRRRPYCELPLLPPLAAHLAGDKHAPDSAHALRARRVGAEAVAARHAAVERREVADAGDAEGQALEGEGGGG